MSLTETYRKTYRHFMSPILTLLDDDEVSEVMVVGPEKIYFEKEGIIHEFSGSFENEWTLQSAVRNVAEYVGREIGGDHHSLDARLPTGERVHAIIPPASRVGTCLTIRKFKRSFFGLGDMVDKGVMGDDARKFLETAVRDKKNIVVAGGTGTGKTTMLNALSKAIPETERVIVIEDSSELKLDQPHTVYLEAQPGGYEEAQQTVTIRDLFVDSLRMRPDRIIVGEVRRGEALDLIQSMISGHSGSLTTVHATTPKDAATRLETLSLMSEIDLPIYAARAQVASAIDLVVQIERKQGKRYVSEISECLGLDGQDYIWRTLFHRVPHDSTTSRLGRLSDSGSGNAD